MIPYEGKDRHKAKSEERVVKSKGQRWHCFAVKKIICILHGLSSKHKGDFYCSNCFHFFITGNKLKSHENLCKNKYFYRIPMPLKKDKILEFNPYSKSDKL